MKSMLKHKYKQVDDYLVVYTNKEEEFLISLQDEHLLSFRTFSSHMNFNGTKYFKCKIKNKRVFLHNLIMNPPKGYVVDHINGNPSDNRRCNLRICTQYENTLNKKTQPNNLLGITGVQQRGNKYVARISKQGKSYYLGRFDTLEEAITKRKEAEEHLFGEFRRV